MLAICYGIHFLKPCVKKPVCNVRDKSLSPAMPGFISPPFTSETGSLVEFILWEAGYHQSEGCPVLAKCSLYKACVNKVLQISSGLAAVIKAARKRLCNCACYEEEYSLQLVYRNVSDLDGNQKKIKLLTSSSKSSARYLLQVLPSCHRHTACWRCPHSESNFCNDLSATFLRHCFFFLSWGIRTLQKSLQAIYLLW